MNTPITNQPSLPVWKRRTAWLALVPVVAILSLAAMPQAQSSQANIENSEAQIEGSWLVTITIPDGPPPFKSLMSYAAGGVVIASDSSVFPVYPMTTLFHGTWTKTGRREFVFTMITFQYDETITPPGLCKIIAKETVTIEPGDDAYNGKGTVEWYDPAGNMYFTGSATSHATRINAE
jgi:hypothetical protein